jgi:ATP-dependent DNA helicase RecG
MPYTFGDIKKWVTEWEGPALEFKLNVSERIGHTISAFANTYGGIIVLGISPKKEFIGINNPDNTSIQIRRIIDKCSPRANSSQEFVRQDGKIYIVIKVEPFAYSEAPCFFDRKCFIRQGTTNLELYGEELINFLKTRTILNFEELKSRASISDLSIEKISEMLKKRGSNANLAVDDIKSLLFGLHAANYNGDFYLKNIAVMFFAKEPEKFIPNLEIRIVKYAGKEPLLSEIKLDKRISGTAPKLIETTFSIIKEAIGTRYILKGLERQQVPTYPLEVIREAITHAVGHRDYFDSNDTIIEVYEDRLQITNPGGLLRGQTINNFYKTPRHRNPLLYRFLQDMRYGEGLGLGVPLMIRILREEHLPDPEFNNFGNAFRVKIYNQKSSRSRHPSHKLNIRQNEVIAYLKQNKYIKLKDYAKLVGISNATALKDIDELIRQGEVKRVGRFRGAYYELDNNRDY